MAAPARDGSNSEIAQQVGSTGLDCAKVAVLHKKIDEGVGAALVVEVDEKAPVHEPDLLLQLHLHAGVLLAVNGIMEAFDVVEGTFPVLHEDVRGELAPQGAEAAFIVGAEAAVMVEELGSGFVVAAFELESGIAVEAFDILEADVVVLV